MYMCVNFQFKLQNFQAIEKNEEIVRESVLRGYCMLNPKGKSVHCEKTLRKMLELRHDKCNAGILY